MQKSAVDRARIDQVVEQNFAGDWEIFKTTVECFLANYSEGLGELESAIRSGDVEQSMRTAHRLKGESSLFHDPGVTELFKAMEFCARQGELPSLELFKEAKKSLEGLVSDLRGLI